MIRAGYRHLLIVRIPGLSAGKTPVINGTTDFEDVATAINIEYRQLQGRLAASMNFPLRETRMMASANR